VPRSSLSRPATLLVLCCALVTVPLASCGSDGGGDIQQPPVPVSTVTVTAPQSSLQVGQTVQLSATAQDANGTALSGRSFEWSSTSEAVATVSPTGLVTGIAAGQAEIRAVSEGVTGSVTLTVTPTPDPGPVVLGLQQIATGLRFPLYLTSPPGDDRLFIVEKGGAIRVIKGGLLLDAPFLDLTPKVVSAGGEQGLLGLAFAPDYATSGRFFVHYNDVSGENRVTRFQVSADPDRADPVTETVVLGVPQPGVAHNGGQLLFGADGFLYIGIGDGDDRDNGRGQSVNDLFANILRIDVTSADPYTVPPDNPFVATANARPEVWSYGFRNPWRFSFDRTTGDLYIGDVGESDWEEVDYSSAAAGAGKGVNYGWSRMEGQHCFGRQNCDQSGLTLPVLEYNHSEGCSVISGYVYRGAAIPSLQGTYFYADYCQGWVRSFRIQGGAVTEEKDWPELEPGGQVTSFGEDSAGELYLVTQQGGVSKIVAK
jgi:glucose/arabinose dehydrogenase